VATLVLMMNQLLLEAANAERDKFHAAFQQAPFAIGVSLRETNQFIEVNDKFCSFSGYSREELIGHTALELNLWEVTENRTALIAAVDATAGRQSRTATFRRRNGELFEALVSVNRINTHGSEKYIACIADMSEQHAAQKKLQDSESELRASNEELRRFNRAAVGRELDMIRLKRQVNELSAQLGQVPPYSVDFERDVPDQPSTDAPRREV
jgi:PAS domain S-box-containing protein